MKCDVPKTMHAIASEYRDSLGNRMYDLYVAEPNEKGQIETNKVNSFTYRDLNSNRQFIGEQMGFHDVRNLIIHTKGMGPGIADRINESATPKWADSVRIVSQSYNPVTTDCAGKPIGGNGQAEGKKKPNTGLVTILSGAGLALAAAIAMLNTDKSP